MILKNVRKIYTRTGLAILHTPKNIVMVLSVEVAELMELYLWTEQQDSFAVTQEKLPTLKKKC